MGKDVLDVANVPIYKDHKYCHFKNGQMTTNPQYLENMIYLT